MLSVLDPEGLVNNMRAIVKLLKKETRGSEDWRWGQYRRRRGIDRTIYVDVQTRKM